MGFLGFCIKITPIIFDSLFRSAFRRVRPLANDLNIRCTRCSLGCGRARAPEYEGEHEDGRRRGGGAMGHTHDWTRLLRGSLNTSP